MRNTFPSGGRRAPFTCPVRLSDTAAFCLWLLLALVPAACGDGDHEAGVPVVPPGKVSVGEALGMAAAVPLDSDPLSEKRLRDELEAMARAGVRWLRTDFPWDRIEPRQGEFRFEPYDRLVDEAARHGIRVLGLLAYGTPWATTRAELLPGISAVPPPDDPEDYGRFAAAVAAHFQGRVTAWEIWNEPNAGFRFWSPDPDGDPGEYARLLVAGYRGIKGDPNDPADGACEACTVLFAGMFLAGAYDPIVPSGFRFMDEAHRYARRELGVDLGDYYDAVSLHPYSYPPLEALLLPAFAAPEESVPMLGYDPIGGVCREADWAGVLEDARELLRKYGLEKPLWITEFGWPTNVLWPGLVLPRGVSPDTQAAYTVRAFLLGLAAGVERILLYTYMDGEGWPLNQEAAFGIMAYDPSYPDEAPAPTPKPAYTAYGVMAAQLGETVFDRDLRVDLDLPDGAHALRFATPGSGSPVVTVLWDPVEGRGVEVSLPVEPVVEVRLIDLLGLEMEPPPSREGSLRLRLSPRPVYVVETR